MSPVTPRGVLLDLGGVVFVGKTLLPGAREALGRLRAAGLGLRFLTNTSRRTAATLRADLAEMGLEVAPAELLTPAQLARDYLVAHHLSPILLVHEALEPEFEGIPAGNPPAVVIGDAAERFTYRRLNTAYRALESGAEFLALAENRNFLDADGALSLDAGPFVRALEYASRRRATVLGKPSPEFFRLALESLGVPADAAVMIGDDVEADIAGALAAGIPAVLVRTGKYRPGDERQVASRRLQVCDDLAAAIDRLLGS